MTFLVTLVNLCPIFPGPSPIRDVVTVICIGCGRTTLGVAGGDEAKVSQPNNIFFFTEVLCALLSNCIALKFLHWQDDAVTVRTDE